MLNYQNLYNEKEYKILFKEFYTPLVIFTNQFIHNRETSEDIVQEIFVRIWEKELKFENDQALRTYLYRSAQNRCINYIRHKKIELRHEAEISEELQAAEPHFFTSLIRDEVYRQLFTAIDHLPHQCKKICQLTLEGKKPSEIADILGLAVETVKKQKKIALKRIQNRLGRFSIFALLAQLLFLSVPFSLTLYPKEKLRNFLLQNFPEDTAALTDNRKGNQEIKNTTSVTGSGQRDLFTGI